MHDVRPGDRVRYRTVTQPEELHTGTLRHITASPDGNGSVLVIVEDHPREKPLRVKILQSPRILSMERVSQNKTDRH